MREVGVSVGKWQGIAICSEKQQQKRDRALTRNQKGRSIQNEKKKQGVDNINVVF